MNPTRRFGATFAALLVPVVVLCGCDATSRFASPIDRINAAMPLSPQVVSARQALLAEIAPDKSLARDDAERWAGRMKIRALTCGRGYEPGLLTSDAAIRERMTDRKCFDDADTTLLRATGLARLKVALSQAPAKSIPKEPLVMLGHQEMIQSVTFARQAPVAIVRGASSVAVLDMTDGHAIFQSAMANDVLRPLALSANGRLWTQSTAGKTVIRSSEHGETLVELPDVQAVVWVDDSVLLVMPGNGKPARLVDLWLGEESMLTGSNMTEVVAVRPVPGEKKRFVLLGAGKAVQFDLVPNAGHLEGRIVAEQRGAAIDTASNTGEASADGSTWVDGSQELRFLSLAGLETKTLSLRPLQLQHAWPTPDPDRYLLIAYLRDGGGRVTSTPSWYVYSRSADTLARMAVEPNTSPQFVWMEPIGRLGVVEGARIRTLEPLKTAEARPVAVVTGEVQMELNERKLAEAGALDSSATIRSMLPQTEFRDIAVEGVGVYQGRGAAGPRAFASHEPGYVEVRIKRTSRPIALVLSSYEPVRWLLIREPGANLASVLVSSYHPSTVVGAGSARVLQIGQAHAYRRDSPEYVALQQAVAQWTGRSSMVFQGRYDGTSFEVGGS